MALSYVDMIGVPYLLHGVLPSGLDCSTTCEEVLRRLGLQAPPTSAFRYPASSGELGEFEKYMNRARSKVTRVGTHLGAATRVGDLLLVSDPAGVGQRGMYVLVEQDLFLTSHPRTGVTPTTRQAIMRLRPTILGVYRCKEATA